MLADLNSIKSYLHTLDDDTPALCKAKKVKPMYCLHYLALICRYVAENVRAKSLFTEGTGAKATPHLTVLIGEDAVPVPAYQTTPYQVR